MSNTYSQTTKFASHIIITPDGTNHFSARCSYCDSRGIIDVSVIANDSPILASETKRINREHADCGAKCTVQKTAAYDANAMKKAQQQATAAAVAMSRDEKDGARNWNAIEKAIKEIAVNKTIQFDGKVLTFVSGRSGKRRFVTESGCTELCDCKNGISYHRALFDVFSRYFQILNENVIAFPTRKNGVVAEACGCRFNWNDRFYESLCAKHDEIERQREWAMQEEWDSYFEAA